MEDLYNSLKSELNLLKFGSILVQFGISNMFKTIWMRLESCLKWRQWKLIRIRWSNAFFKDTFNLMLNTSQNIILAVIFGMIYIRYPRLNSEVPYNEDDLIGINGCFFVLIILSHFQVWQKEKYLRLYTNAAWKCSDYIWI